jgi:pantoate--beta-alanine ligase
MKVFREGAPLQVFLSKKHNNQNLGFVPTMGALHKGHLSLIKQAKKDNKVVVVSIFVNPTQFNNQDDLDKYPRTLNADIEALKGVHCDIVFVPNVNEIYPGEEASNDFNFSGLEKVMEGKYRPGHFNGVATVVKRFFEIVKPTNAYFGEKDYQQLLIIKKMVSDLKIPVNIISCPIFRESSGLAMSSRNERLSDQYRKKAVVIYKSLQKIKADLNNKSLDELYEEIHSKFKKLPFIDLEYFIIADADTLDKAETIDANKRYRAFIAAYVEGVRLIDNIALQ